MRAVTRFRGIYNFLSNFYDSPICYRDLIYPTAEHLFQALKTNDEIIRETIRKEPFAFGAKSLGRQIKGRDDWEAVKDKVMFIVVKLKFLQNDNLRRRLLKLTKRRPIAEYNYHHDNYWGDCRCPRCRTIPGQNQLGKTLMKVRDLLSK